MRHLDEIFEALTLIRTKQIRPVPVVLVGTDYWSGLWGWISGTLLERKVISPEDLDLVTILDDVDEAVKVIQRAVIV